MFSAMLRIRSRLARLHSTDYGSIILVAALADDHFDKGGNGGPGGRLG